ncbi:MAG: Transcriptional regulatory protein algP [Candidatus Ozemobacter sibiricus]|jgi:hypothetical protein|uniref:Transcriptional regulatory protein algP n=1 Tax=Candidatus Ozemobacter sibiricus TaxID=2268124 RepID=A0A367ZS55_9BACT|nr:MAG: Transcriptional regulatory protein algP [Candidatus Ozemobacter sibiricus]
MSFQRGVLIGSALLAIGSLSWASASAPAGKSPAASALKPAASPTTTNKVLPRLPAAKIETVSQMPANQDLGGGLSLVAPPAELPRAVTPTAIPAPAASAHEPTARAGESPTVAAARPAPAPASGQAAAAPRSAKSSEQLKALTEKVRAQLAAETTASAAPTARKQNRPPSALAAAPAPAAGELTIVPAPQERPTGQKAAAAPGKAANPRQQVQSAAAAAAKPGKLFSYVRLLNYAPHPTVEEFLKDRPLVLKDRQYWFSVKYIEGWKALNDEEGLLQNVCFEISLMDGDRKVRTLRTPKVDLKPERIAKGQVLGIVEVPPYRFYITVDQFTLKKKGIADLVFKLDLLG